MKHNIQRKDAGMSLIELMLACGIIAGLMVAVMGSVISMNQVSAISDNRLKAIAQLESVLEEIRGLPSEQWLTYRPPTPSGLHAGAAFTVVCYKADGATVALPNTNSSITLDSLPNPVEIKVTLTWTGDRSRAMTQSASTLFWR